MATTTKQFPAANLIYAARYEDGLTWSEMRAHFSVSARSSRFLSECVAYVNADDALLAKHPEMALIPVGGETYVAVGADARATIRAERERGVGLAMLRERTGLTMAVLRKIVGEEVGTTSRVAWGARYAGKAKPEAEATPEGGDDAASSETAPQVVEATTAPEAAKPEAAKPEAPAEAAPAPKRRSRKRAPKAAA